MSAAARRRVCTVTACLLTALALGGLVWVAPLPEPWRDVPSDAADGTSRPLPSGSRHPAFTGPRKYELLDAWNNMHTESGRKALEDGMVTDGELSEAHTVYNECLSVYGLQSRPVDGGEGETVVTVRGSMDERERDGVIRQCGAESDYTTLRGVASQGDSHPSSRVEMRHP
ncbi:hypothetical protein [Bifidobacterium aesculapii]|uniref:hypothetical protein n=1 Tax=Bifidobacterium aesculapii TaxID=1329411 RepID=UPI0006E20208|nr:hypothetical protein [Bifidobacterium aesculapii]